MVRCLVCGAMTPQNELHICIAAQALARVDELEAENRRLREALDVIATCPAEAVHLMPLAAQAALAGEVPGGE